MPGAVLALTKTSAGLHNELDGKSVYFSYSENGVTRQLAKKIESAVGEP